MLAGMRWNALDPRLRTAIIAVSAFEAGLKVAALVDLCLRSRDELRLPKPVWAAALVAVNSGGALPLYYFLRGRRR